MIQSSKLENTTFLGLGLYYRNHCISTIEGTVAATVTPGVLQPSPIEEISSRDLRWKRDSLEIKEWSLNHFLGLSGMKVGADHFLNSQVRIMPTISEILQTEISFNVGSTLTPLLSKKDEASVRSHLRDQNGKNLS
jgi:hypothetical protein